MEDIHTRIMDRLALVWRRRWLVLGVSWVVCGLGWAAVLAIPNQFTAQALVYIDTSTLLGPLLKNLTVENDVQQELPLIQRTLLTRPNLHKVAVATDMELAVRTPLDELNLMERMEKRAAISAQGSDLFLISYTDSNPTLTRDVVQALLSVLVENDAGQNRADMQKAQDFIESQVLNYEGQLRTIENNIAEFKRAHVEETESNPDDMGAREDAARQAVAQAKSDLDDAQAKRNLLAEQIKQLPQFLSVDNAPEVIVNGQPDLRQAHIADLQQKLDALRLQYTDQYPDVIAAKQQLADLVAESRSAPRGGAVEGASPRDRSQTSNIVYEQTQMQLMAADQALVLAQDHVTAAEAEQAREERLATADPAIAAEYTDMTRQYDVLKKQYDELLVRRESARMSEAVENTSQKVQFRVIESPSVPLRPAVPKRMMFLPLVLIVGLAAGCGMAFLLEMLEMPITSEKSLYLRSGLPFLGAVSLVAGPGLRIRPRQATVSFALAATTLLLGFACALAVANFTSSTFTLPFAAIERYLTSGG